MQYTNNAFVVCVKVNGQILREQEEIVFIPFGSEFSIFLRNLNSVRAVVKVEIDGKDVLNGRELVVMANSSTDLERFLTDSIHEGRRFKFIERTASIEDYRGIRAEDGLIRVSFRFEKVVPKQTYIRANSFSRSGGLSNQSYGAMEAFGSMEASGKSLRSSMVGAKSIPRSDVGITVEGSNSNQRFTQMSVGQLEDIEHVIVLKLSGYMSDAPVSAPVTVSTKKECSSCGKVYSSSVDYCSTDGTYLNISL